MDPDEEGFLQTHRSHDVAHLLRRWRKVARAAGLQMETLAEQSGYPIVGLRHRRPPDGEGLYLSTGIHGDEPGAVLGLLGWAEANAGFLRGTPVVIFPCVNPWGLVHNVRIDGAGRDLNRSFDRCSGEPIGAMLDFISGHRFSVAVSLHEDYEANGVYLYELARAGEYWGEALLDRVEPIVPRHRGPVDGRKLRRAVMRRTRGLEKITKLIDGTPESIHLFLHHARTALTFETPSEYSLYRRARAHAVFLDAVMDLRRAGEQ